MAYFQTRTAGFDELIAGTFSQLKKIKRELAIYFGAFFVLGVMADLFRDTASILTLAMLLGYFFGQYYLYRKLLSVNGILCDPETKVFSMFFMALLISAGIIFGLNFFILPGLILAGKWVMAPTYLVAEEMNLFEAIGGSWRASERNTLMLTCAFTVLSILWVFIAALFTGLVSVYLFVMGTLGASATWAAADDIWWLGLHALPIILMGLSVNAYLLLSDQQQNLTEVFE